MEKVKSELGDLGKKLTASLVSDAVFIGVITILGYLFTYAYLISRAHVLGIPELLVSVSLEMCLVVILALMIISFILTLIVNVTMSEIPERLRQNILLRTGTLLSVMSIGIILFGLFTNPVLFGVLIFPVLAVGYCAIVPLLEPKDGRTYFQRLNDKLEANAKIARARKSSDWLDAHLGFKMKWVLLIPFFGICAFFEVGKADGEFTTYYFVTSSNPPEVLLSHYGDMLVFRRLGSSAITIRVIGKDEIPPLTYMHTGSIALARTE